MARYVVVEFADNAEAQAFVDELNEECSKRRKEGNPFIRRVTGIFVKPGQTCNCNQWQRLNSGDKNFMGGNTVARGAKFGWWVCSFCNKPRKAGHQLVNQIKPSETFEGPAFDDYETCVTDLSVSGFHTDQITRPKKLRRKKAK